MTLVFVYGTLKRGSSNHSHLAGQEFMGTARTVPGYTLFNLDGYPGMVRQEGDLDGVKGEVWSVDDACLAALDELEGVSEGLYRREAVPLAAPFAERSVEAYLYLREFHASRKVGAEWFG
jgi:gamma-glutamylcyclotransferase (GGCT)/AIG2-like uncharacterized protein YtfP